MKEHILSILDRLIEKDYIVSYNEEPENTFELQYGGGTEVFSKHGHRTWLIFEVSDNSEVLNVQSTHLCGQIDIEQDDPLKLANGLLKLLIGNNPDFHNSGAYLCIVPSNGELFVALKSNHSFLTKWDPSDIGDILCLKFLELYIGFSSPWPDSISLFS